MYRSSLLELALRSDRPAPCWDTTSPRLWQNRLADVDDYEVIAQELSDLAEKIQALADRVSEVKRVNARLQDAALTTACALAEVSRHWDAVYDAMRRAEAVDSEASFERDNAAARVRRQG